MSTRRNYLIGRGELLAAPVDAPKINPSGKVHPYTVQEARRRLAPELARAVERLKRNSDFAPNDSHVLKFTLHPSYVAKSYFPASFFRQFGLERVGSRDRTLTPEKHVVKGWEEKTFATSELYVAGPRRDLQRLSQLLSSTKALPDSLLAIREFEEIEYFSPEEKVRGLEPDSSEFELVLHLPSLAIAPDNQAEFLRLAERVGIDVRPDLGFVVRGLWFLPATGSADGVRELARYSTLRVARPMPSLSVAPVIRSVLPTSSAVQLPRSGAVLDNNLRVAVLDGGLPAAHPLAPWVDSYVEMNPSATAVDAFTEHGLAVTSALLFGPLNSTVRTPTPPAKVSVFRILDSETANEAPFELYRTLGHIEEVLLSGSFDYVNLSLGPALPIEDDDVHAWTALLDDLLGDGTTLMTVAVGNNGEQDRASGNARVQVPGDAINALSVGAYARGSGVPARAPYSAVGPGRSPGRVKPDILAFGGDVAKPFTVVGTGSGMQLIDTEGTSFAAPFALHQGTSIRATLGAGLSPLAIRALLVHSASAGTHPIDEVGWGLIPESLDDIIVAGPGVARVVYQGEVRPGKYVRAQIPTPAAGLRGVVEIAATFCFASPVDVQSPDVYTRAGLEVRFRPDLNKFKPGAATPSSRPFFTSASYADESTRRAAEGKWETVLSATDTFRGSTLVDPAFDIHYLARDGGGASRETNPLKYALVITIRAAKTPDLHDSILAAYPDLLVPIEPRIEIENLPAQ